MLFDTSTSITEEGFWSMKRFATFMIQLMEEEPTETRVCLVRFPMGPTLLSSFTKFSSSDHIESSFGSLVYGDGDTDFEEGLRVAADELFREESGTRPKVSKILIVFSDGAFGGYYLDPRINATHVITVASGTGIHRGQLESLVKDPKKDFFTIVDGSAESVVQRMNELTQQDCS
ncbi:cartilage matrix protein-like [Stylophora pistillata]|nr:cartilage matrix protein-like [Stylophora pistillata]